MTDKVKQESREEIVKIIKLTREFPLHTPEQVADKILAKAEPLIRKDEKGRIISELKKRLVTTGGKIEANGRTLTVLACFRQDDWLWQAIKGEG